MSKPWVARVLPFFIYMSFVMVQTILEPLIKGGAYSVLFTPALYALKIICVTISLILLWKHYDELSLVKPSFINVVKAALTGTIVFILWINMDWSFATMGSPDAYNPNLLPLGLMYTFTAIRIAGAAIIVPIFEELFWRSFILRYIINNDFLSVRIGTFTLSSFVVSSILFGFEHHFWLAGIAAGVLYNLLLYSTKNLCYPVFAHGLTNLMLGIYVVKTGEWIFW